MAMKTVSTNLSDIKPGLERISELTMKLGSPERALKFVHTVGSNGKGSTCAMIESVLRAAGYRTGFFLSPAVLSYNETFQVAGEPISDEDLRLIMEKVGSAAASMEDQPSPFEKETAAAFLYFKEQKCDIVILEAGMGGELDSTNVIPAPEAAVITNIGLEHTQFLGNTLGEIARAKAGIIKRGADVILYKNTDEVTDAVREVCDKAGCSLRVSDPEKEVRSVSKSLAGQVFEWSECVPSAGSVPAAGSEPAAGSDPESLGRQECGKVQIKMSLLGEHQLRNAAVALDTISVLRKRGYKISDNDIVTGFANIKWPVRFEVMSTDPVFIIDCAHNPQCAEALTAMIREYLPGEKITLLMGVLSDKDYIKMIEMLEPLTAEFICITPDSARALPAEELARILKARGDKAAAYDSIEEAVAACKATGRATVTCTSLYISGKVREVNTRDICLQKTALGS